MLAPDCITHTITAYKRRANKDTHPKIMRHRRPDGSCDNHWYYLSDEAVSTSAFDWDGKTLTPAYEGPREQAPEVIREQLRYGVEERLFSKKKTRLRL